MYIVVNRVIKSTSSLSPRAAAAADHHHSNVSTKRSSSSLAWWSCDSQELTADTQFVPLPAFSAGMWRHRHVIIDFHTVVLMFICAKVRLWQSSATAVAVSGRWCGQFTVQLYICREDSHSLDHLTAWCIYCVWSCYDGTVLFIKAFLVLSDIWKLTI